MISHYSDLDIQACFKVYSRFRVGRISKGAAKV